MPDIPITRPFFGEEELRAVQLPLESEWVVQGPFVQQFEKSFSTYTGAEHSIATSSCTTALHIAVSALGLLPGDEVIVPAFTWISTANVVEYMGAKPVFCDVDLETYNIDPKQVETAITDRTVGIIPVHLFGLSAPMSSILGLASTHGLWVLEDAACSFGGWYDGKHTGTIGDAGCFSFHPRKSITTGEGGMITTGRADLSTLSRSLRDHGASKSDRARHASAGSYLLSEYNHLGFNFRLTDIQGALGVAQMQRADWILGRRQELAASYDQLLAEIDWLQTPQVPENCVHGYQAYVCLFRPDDVTVENTPRLHEQRNLVMARLEERGIATRQGTHAPVLSGYYAGKYELRAEQFPGAYAGDRLTLGLPLYPQMTEADQDRVVTELAQAFVSV